MSEETDRAVLGARLKEARDYRGFSQEDVAKYLQIPRSAVSLIESGVRRLDTLELKRLAGLYQCSLDELTGRERADESEADEIDMVARATATLSPDDRAEVLRFAQFLKSRKQGKQE